MIQICKKCARGYCHKSGHPLATTRCNYYVAEATESLTPSGQAEFDLLSAKSRAKLYVDANVWDGEDRSGCLEDQARFTPDELQEFIGEVLEHLST